MVALVDGFDRPHTAESTGNAPYNLLLLAPLTDVAEMPHRGYCSRAILRRGHGFAAMTVSACDLDRAKAELAKSHRTPMLFCRIAPPLPWPT